MWTRIAMLAIPINMAVFASLATSFYKNGNVTDAVISWVIVVIFLVAHVCFVLNVTRR